MATVSIISIAGTINLCLIGQVPIFLKQSDFQFDFIPKVNSKWQPTQSMWLTQICSLKCMRLSSRLKNFLKATYVMSQLNVEVWQAPMKDYWDQQLLQLLRFGFPLDFNRNGPLHLEGDKSLLGYSIPR